MSENIVSCPSCDCEQVVKNGFTHKGKQNFLCKSCGRPQPEMLRLRNLF